MYLLATSNPHKLDELRAIFAACAADQPGAVVPELCDLADLEQAIEEPVEDGDTFEANAMKKAAHYAAESGLACLADDSGLEVDALGGEPGVYSARYAGADGPRAEVDLANNRLLLQKLADTPIEKRAARFVCAMAWCDAPGGAGKPVVLRGTVEGRIILPSEAADADCPERGIGSNGFGYDPLFFVPDLGCTTAQLEPDRKNAISHRGNAARKMFAALQSKQQ